MNILIVDDEEVLQDVLVTLLRKAGFKPLPAGSGEEALEILEREPIDLVLLDLMLPGMHGMDVLREVRRKDPNQVVVVVTAFLRSRAPSRRCAKGPSTTSPSRSRTKRF